MSADVARDDREDRAHPDDAARAGHGPASAPFDPWAPSHGHEKAGDDLVVDARGLAQAEQQRGTPPVTGRTEMNEVRLTFRALIEQVRLVLRDGRRLIRQLIVVCETSPRSKVQMTSSLAPLVSVPLVVLRSTTEREQIELNGLVQSLSAEGHQVTRRGPQWVVYTEITDRRKSASGGSPHDSRGVAATSEPVSSGPLPHRRKDDDEIANAQHSVIAGHPGDTSRRQPPMFW